MRRLFLLLWLLPPAAWGCNLQSATPQAAPKSNTSAEKPAPEAPVSLSLSPSFDAAAQPPVAPRFTEVASSSGLDFVYFNDEVPERYFLPEVMGGGLAWFDFDGDGLLDLLAANGAPLVEPLADQQQHLDRLWRNLGQGRFQEVTSRAAAHDGGFGQGYAIGDFDADGFADVLLTNYDRTHRRATVLLHNQGDGSFRDVTELVGFADDMWGSGAAWADLNGDGNLDVYVVSYMDVPLERIQVCTYGDVRGYCGPGQYEGEPDRVYLSNGAGGFEESSRTLGLVAERGSGLAISILDLDHDLRAEIYVANDMTPNFLFTQGSTAFGQPDAPGRYLEIGNRAGCAVSDDGQAEASMGLACADFDGDQQIDIFLTHFYQHKNTLYQNLGGLLFKDDSRRSRMATIGYELNGFGTLPLDYDRDGAVDLFVTNGHVLGPHYTPNAMRAQLMRNDGRGRFDDVSEQAGPYFQELFYGRCAAGGDYDQDGDLDVAVSHLHRPLALLRNDTAAPGHFLGLDLRTLDRIPPVGGRVEVTAGSRRWTYPIATGGSYLAHNDARLLVTLPPNLPSVQLKIFWPGGQVDEYSELPLDRYYRILPGAWPVAIDAPPQEPQP